MKSISKLFKDVVVNHVIRGRFLTQLARFLKLPVTAVKYFPYKYGEDSFYIPKLSEGQIKKHEDGFSIPPAEMWQGYGKTQDEYLASGKKHVQRMLEILEAGKFTFDGGNRILELGCGSGRMIRHLREFADSDEVWGTDVCAEYVIWCKQYLSPPFHFVTTTTIPHLPFEDGFFDFVYAGSVFTHIDDLPDAWLLELRRVLSPSGMLYVTLHDEHTIKLLDTVYKNEWFERYLNADPVYSAQKEKARMIVVGRSTDAQVFYDIDYFINMLQPMFDVVSVVQEAYGYQTAILLKKR